MLLNMLVVITILWVCFLKEILIFQKYWNIHRWNDIFDFFQNNSKLGDRCGYRWNKTAYVLNSIKTAVMIKGFTIIFSLLLYMFENIHNIFSKGIYQNFEKKKKEVKVPFWMRKHSEHVWELASGDSKIKRLPSRTVKRLRLSPFRLTI